MEETTVARLWEQPLGAENVALLTGSKNTGLPSDGQKMNSTNNPWAWKRTPCLGWNHSCSDAFVSALKTLKRELLTYRNCGNLLQSRTLVPVWISGDQNHWGPSWTLATKRDTVRILSFAFLIGVSPLLFPFFPLHSHSFTHLLLSWLIHFTNNSWSPTLFVSNAGQQGHRSESCVFPDLRELQSGAESIPWDSTASLKLLPT